MADTYTYAVTSLEQCDLPVIMEKISKETFDCRQRKVDSKALLKYGFGDDKLLYPFVLKRLSKSVSNSKETIVGYAFYIYLYSTWVGRFISVDDLLIFVEDESLTTHFVNHFILLAQDKLLPRVDFQVACDSIKSSSIIAIGAKPLMQWYTVRFPTPALKSLTSTRNEQVHLKYHIRHATLCDLESILFLIQSLAEYEYEPNAVQITVKDLEDGLGHHFQCFVAETDSTLLVSSANTNGDLKSNQMPHNPAIIGMALYLPIFCRRVGKVIHLEDLFVLPQYRKQGLGTELMKEVANAGLSTECVQMDLQVLDWNKSASDLYVKLGGELRTDYVISRIERNNFGKILNN